MVLEMDQIANISIDMDDEWQYENNDTEISCKLYGLEDYADFIWSGYKEDYPDAWVDIYATINLNGDSEEYVSQIEFVLVTNSPDDNDKSHTEVIGYTKEGRMLAERLKKTSNGGLQWMIDEVKQNENI